MHFPPTSASQPHPALTVVLLSKFSWSHYGKNALHPSLFTVAQTVKNVPAMQETYLQSLGWEDPLEEGMATHSSILAWRIPGTEEPGGLHTVHGVAKSQTRLSN